MQLPSLHRGSRRSLNVDWLPVRVIAVHHFDNRNLNAAIAVKMSRPGACDVTSAAIREGNMRESVRVRDSESVTRVARRQRTHRRIVVHRLRSRRGIKSLRIMCDRAAPEGAIHHGRSSIAIAEYVKSRVRVRSEVRDFRAEPEGTIHHGRASIAIAEYVKSRKTAPPRTVWSAWLSCVSCTLNYLRSSDVQSWGAILGCDSEMSPKHSSEGERGSNLDVAR